ncbi:Por secretion system C-terminal sorting domain-containing protein [Maribacter dokdonensis]|uniref:T9SS type A sorting domain-containing protein n=1 Tax=Maribacter dokdonensis TaxID=320912 RepID=UPI001B139854|nr:T9SS type A sorting domain-containing protein [Maribacter dokdonensis]CAG2532804.1 Por secretion system C-terminal sorting domain-containing protein [Maribacter dokdonensis]
MRKLYILFLFLSFSAFSQIQIDSRPYALDNPVDYGEISGTSRLIFPPKSIKSALEEDEIDANNGRPPRFGLKVDVTFSTQNSGVWTDLPNGDKLWRLAIKSPGAKSINLLYDQFHLPPGGVLHIYNEDMTHIIGGFTELNNKGTLESPGMFATGLVYGNEVILEYYHPTDVEQEVIISIKGVVHGYKYIHLLDKFIPESNEEIGYGDSGACQVNVNCAEGNNWQDEKQGVAMLLINDGTRWCTGSLINNTSQDATPFFLTADHCLDFDNLDATGNTNASQWMFYWNYETPNCNNPVNEPAISSTTGATLRANRADTDFALFELTESPLDAGFDVYFNGWDRTTNPQQGGVGIHHPAGDVKKIATHNMVPGNGIVWGGNTHWRVNWQQTANGWSVTEGGSSGSPLFMNNGRIIGQLHGGSSVNCTDPANDPGEYGRFNLSWNGLQANRRLRDWLDPLGANPQHLNGADLFAGSISGDDCACSSPNEAYTLSNPPASITWQFPTNLLTQVSTTGATITLKAKDSQVRGFATLTARNGATNAIVAQKSIYVGKPATPYGNISGDFSVYHGALENYNYYSTVDGATSYTWWLPYPYINTNTVYTDPVKWSRLYGSGTTKNLRSQVGPNSGLVQFMGVNKCGTGGAKINSVTVSGGGGGPQPLMANFDDFEFDLNFGSELFMMYPNPADSEVYLFFQPEYQEDVYEVSIFDMSGRLVYHSLNTKVNQIDVSSYQPGLYNIIIKGNDGIISKRLSKR